MGKNKDKGSKVGSSTGTGVDGLSGPGAGGQFTAKDHIGELLLIKPTGVELGIKTSNGDADATAAQVVILDEDNPAGSEVVEGALIFQKVLQSQLSAAITSGTRVVGRLFLDEAAKKSGQSAPYKLSAPTESEIQAAKAFLDSLDPLR